MAYIHEPSATLTSSAYYHQIYVSRLQSPATQTSSTVATCRKPCIQPTPANQTSSLIDGAAKLQTNPAPSKHVPDVQQKATSNIPDKIKRVINDKTLHEDVSEHPFRTNDSTILTRIYFFRKS
jgi:hypothetical protein